MTPTNCPKCGQPLTPGQHFCGSCGAPIGSAPCPQQPPYPNPGYNYQGAYQQWYQNDAFASGPGGKSRGVAALLAIFLGGLGIQYFYLGKVMAGILSIVITLCTCGIWEILTLIQGILMFCMDNQTFEQKYVNTNSSFPLF